MNWSGFEMVRSIGVGATSEVFEVINTSTKQHSALKVFSQLALSDPALVGRFQNEIEILNQLRHPNIVGFRSHQRKQDGAFALELELIDGSDLRHWLNSYELPLIEPKLWLLAQVARGLGAAHEMGVIHRDLKPENILVSQMGEVKITDFGLARQINRLTITRLGLLVGSLGYIAPEVIAGKKATEMSDIFSLGVIAYEVLCGRSPFEGETPQAMIRQITDGEVRPPRQLNPRIPESLSLLIEQCLEKDPKKRLDGIWLLEAHLMTAISSSGLLPYGKALVSTALRQNAISDAFKTKLQNLKTQIQAAKVNQTDGLKDATPETRARAYKKAMAAVTEVIDLFPDQEGLDEMVQEVRKQEPVQKQKQEQEQEQNGRLARYRTVFFIVLFVSGVGVSVWFWAGLSRLSQIPTPSSTDLQAPPPQIISPPRTSEPIATPTGESASRVPPPPNISNPPKLGHLSMSASGSIQFDVDEDVSIFVDGKPVPKAKWSNFPIRVGKHQVLLVKEGFVPIEQVIQVNAHKSSVIRARGRL